LIVPNGVAVSLRYGHVQKFRFIVGSVVPFSTPMFGLNTYCGFFGSVVSCRL